jgi:hypothetical protein
MTRTALAPTSPLPPCMLAPELWDSSDSTEAIAACRQQCPRRFACAQEALAAPKHLVSTLNGVIAGVAIPAQNEYGTSKAHKAALKRLETIAEIGREPTAATTNPCARPRRAAAAVDQAEALTSLSAKQIQPSVEDQEVGGEHQPPVWHQPDMAEVIVLPGGWRVTSYWSPAGRENRSSPAGTVDASSGGRYWARNDCSTDGCCSASGAAGVAARSSVLSSGRSLVVQQRVPS